MPRIPTVHSAIPTVYHFGSFHYQPQRSHQTSRVLSSFCGRISTLNRIGPDDCSEICGTKAFKNGHLVLEDGAPIAEWDEILEQYCLARTSFQLLAENL